MSGSIFVLKGDDDLVEMRQEGYLLEAHLQDLLAKYPSLLAGDGVNPTAPRRWLLVKKEAGLADREDAGARWSLDHLFLDQDAIPTLVEVKRSSDTRIRREVVGQMLDYAANAVVYLPIEQIRGWFDERCRRDKRDPADVMAEALGPDIDPDAFWMTAKTNLQAGRIRLVFVADEIPPELQRIVEFLNGQMDPAEVIAIAIPQFVGKDAEGHDLKTLVPTVIGRTADAERKKGGVRGAGRQWDEDAFFAGLGDVEPVGRALVTGALDAGIGRVSMGKGGAVGALHVHADAFGVFVPLFSLYQRFGDGGAERVELQFSTWRRREYLSSEGVRDAFIARLNAIEGIGIPPDKHSAMPTFPLAVLRPSSARDRFLAAFVDLMGDMRRAEADAR